MKDKHPTQTHKQRILVIAPTPYFSDRGCHIRIYEETKALSELGHTVEICTYHIGRDLVPTGALLKRIRAFFATYKKYDAGWHWMKPLLDLQLLALTVKEIKKFQPTVIHAHLQEGIAIGWIARKLTWSKAILVFDSQGDIAEEFAAAKLIKQKGLIARIVKWVEKCLVKSADIVVTSSEPLRSVYTKYKKKNLLVVNDAPMSTTSLQTRKSERREQLGIPSTAQVIIYTGSLLPYKGIDDFLQASALVVKHFADVFIVVVGYPNREKYQHVAKNLGIPSSQILFTGRIPYEQLASYLQIADVGVEPKKNSNYESSEKVLNYLAGGLKVVAYRSAHLEHVLGKTHPWFAKQETPECLATVIEDALHTQSARILSVPRSWKEEMYTYTTQIEEGHLASIGR